MRANRQNTGLAYPDCHEKQPAAGGDSEQKGAVRLKFLLI
ncbi:hypothetical protein Pla110_07380 [Polystyrenella longa]|uniref:Uncharacterized protein n=1 Tax=Polystyrenella longa TaxID=2528007 RepID=A0A518CIM7_9PLAN|nr:hypothetical protein Pla110_07380 [Polystyrenella longa]